MTQPKKKRVSQAQIAKTFGCSQALVSMALNEHTKGISDKTYDAIRELAAQQGYAPKGMKIEGSLGGLQQSTIGYILRSPLKLANKSNFFSHIHQGLHEHSLTHKLKTVYVGSEDDLNHSQSSFASHFPESIRGIVIMGEVDPDFLGRALEANRPLVYVSARASGLCHSVLSNEYESGELLVEHLYKLGHRTFAWLGGSIPKGRHDDRLQAIETALRKRGLAIESSAKATFNAADRRDGYKAAKHIIDKNAGLPTAWICLNALMARGAINRLLQHKVEIGKTVSIAAFDMTRVCEEEHPTLTSAGADPEVMGREAGKILTQSIEANSAGLIDVTLPATLKVRESTGPALKVQPAD